MQEPAIGLIELRSIARGMAVVDALVKKAPVHLRVAHPISPGHFILVFSGGVAEVEESLVAGLDVAGDAEIGNVFLPGVHPAIPSALSGASGQACEPDQSLLILETFTIAATIEAADMACKAAPLRIIQMRLGQGLGGKAFVVLSGDLHDAEAGRDAAVEGLGEGVFQETTLIPRPHPDMLAIYR